MNLFHQLSLFLHAHTAGCTEGQVEREKESL